MLVIQELSHYNIPKRVIYYTDKGLIIITGFVSKASFQANLCCFSIKCMNISYDYALGSAVNNTNNLQTFPLTIQLPHNVCIGSMLQ